MFSRKSSYKLTIGLFLALSALWVMSCQKKDAAANDPARLGRTLYTLHCMACHSPDPRKDGALGPALKGSGLELLQARVLRGEYPPGYAPKRATQIMRKLPLSDSDVAAIHAYLNAP